MFREKLPSVALRFYGRLMILVVVVAKMISLRRLNLDRDIRLSPKTKIMTLFKIRFFPGLEFSIRALLTSRSPRTEGLKPPRSRARPELVADF